MLCQHYILLLMHNKAFSLLLCPVLPHPRGVVCSEGCALLLNNLYEVTTISQPNSKLEIAQVTIQIDCHRSIPSYFSQSVGNNLRTSQHMLNRHPYRAIISPLKPASRRVNFRAQLERVLLVTNLYSN